MDFKKLGITGICIDSRAVRPGDLFVCVEGINVDGHGFVGAAVAAGAVAVICRKGREGEMPAGVPFFAVDDTRIGLAAACELFFGSPARNMKLIGITGTNGKTSTCAFLEGILLRLGCKVGSIGTLGARLNGRALNMPFATSTTPDTIELYRILAAMAAAGAEYVVMEVSSHALALHKVAALNFELGLFTNLSQDHLDFHGTMENYRLAKAGLFDLCAKGIINYDDDTRDFLLNYAPCEIATYGLNGGDYQALDYVLQSNRICYTIKGQEIVVPIPGKFTIYNTLCAYVAAIELGFAPADIAAALAIIEGVGGRIQSIANERGFSIIVDYAHSPDGLENIISSCREFTTGRVITVFGCGGDRDALKRPIMGEVAGRLSDFCVITSDNPRNEGPEAIMGQVADGLRPTGCGFARIADRKEAIIYAISQAQPGDCVIIAGKGHENYQEFENGRKIDFDDAQIAKEALGMKPLMIEEIARAVGGRLNKPEIGDLFVRGVSFDSREIAPGDLFVALKGERADGHEFLTHATEAGAICALSQVETDAPAIIVDDTMAALAALAEYYRGLFDIKVIGITGSSGKTSAKDMVAAVLATRFNVVKTMGNFNNEIGLPMTIFRINEATEVAVLEMGMNNRHEIHRLGKIARPDLAVITNIGVAHIENLGSQEEIFKAKSEIMDFLAADGRIFLYGDDEFLMRYREREGAIFYGRNARNSYRPENERAEGLGGSTYKITLSGGEKATINVPTAGRHMVTNSLAAVAIGDYLGLSGEEIARGLANFQPSGMRMDIIETKSGLRIIADCYNANPDSMKAALEVLALAEGETTAILGDMFELGEDSAELHYKTGREAARLCIGTIICVGKEARALYDGALAERDKGASTSEIIYFGSKEALIEHAPRVITPGGTVLVKASRGMRFEEIINCLERL
ncbi:MAG: UDP-N-acetylmuramoyl-L-alanyl-D-glutamate--2,6-diaminopimelate ligase [Clostridiales bacterium]|nr:UDP-N-acetylmuramoyl-L-alanyl-D-glutamate--2,6-diaminopimelate ligase [Clostridiales bacterium]